MIFSSAINGSISIRFTKITPSSKKSLTFAEKKEREMGYQRFDEFATQYDEWFMNNEKLFETELRLVADTLQDAGRILSIGCGSAFFEKSLRDEYGIQIIKGIEPSTSMAEIARKRGFEVEIGTGEEADYGTGLYDTVLFNGCPCYMNDLGLALRKAYASLVPGGRIVVIDVPKESSFGTMYNLAMTLGTWDHPLLNDTKPQDEYPIELVKEAKWRTTADKTAVIEENGFVNIRYRQTLTTLPHYAHLVVEDPSDGYDRGSYVAIIAQKPE